jgi:hypothetical protein
MGDAQRERRGLAELSAGYDARRERDVADVERGRAQDFLCLRPERRAEYLGEGVG